MDQTPPKSPSVEVVKKKILPVKQVVIVLGALVTAAGGAFVAGKKFGGNTTTVASHTLDGAGGHGGHEESAADLHADAGNGADEEHAAKSGVKEKAPKEKKRKDAHPEEGEDRSPASAPDEKNESEDEEEEIEIKFAEHLKKSPSHGEPEVEKKASGDGHEKPDAHAETGGHAKPDAHAEVDGHEKPHAKTGFFTTIRETLAGFQDKVEAVKLADEEAKILRKENATLRLMLETKKYSCRIEESAKQTKTVGDKLNATTGTSVGRTLSAIRYQIPENLLPEQLQALGVNYFKQKDDEKAVSIFTFLTELESDSAYRTSENYLLTAISWYRLENYKKSSEYLEKIIREGVPGKDRERYRIQAKLWMALVAKKQKDRTEVVKWLQNTVENHPHSQEARWVNPQLAENDATGAAVSRRRPASKPAVDGHEVKKTEAARESPGRDGHSSKKSKKPKGGESHEESPPHH